MKNKRFCCTVRGKDPKSVVVIVVVVFFVEWGREGLFSGGF